MTCQHCFSLFLPSLNCSLKYVKRSRLQRLPKQTIRLSHLHVDAAYRSASGKDDIIPVIRCSECKYFTIFDAMPVKLLEAPPKSAPKPVTAPVRKDVLQKAMAVKKDPPKKQEMDLESFLDGFL